MALAMKRAMRPRRILRSNETGKANTADQIHHCKTFVDIRLQLIFDVLLGAALMS